MKKNFKRIALIIGAAFIVSQFIRPDRTNPESNPTKSMEAIQNVPVEISSIMDRACRDCHSNHTVWPWYSNIAPMSWLVVNDIVEGREHLNFSEWGNYKKGKMVKKLSQMAEEVTDNSMPLQKYTFLHSEAKLNKQERKLFSDWAEKEADQMNVVSDDSTE